MHKAIFLVRGTDKDDRYVYSSHASQQGARDTVAKLEDFCPNGGWAKGEHEWCCHYVQQIKLED